MQSRESRRALHRAFGLCYQVSRPLPNLPECAQPADPAVHVELEDSTIGLADPAVFTPVHADNTGPVDSAMRVEMDAAGTQFRLRYPDGVEFRLDREGIRVRSRWTAASTREDAATYLLSSVSGFLLRLRGVTALHASAIATDAGAVLFAGASEAGKSAVAAAFARLGVPVLSDDIAALEESTDGFRVQPGLPRVLIWPDVVEAFWGTRDALSPLVDGWDKRMLALPAAGAAQGRPAPIAAICILEERGTHDEIELVRLRGSEATVALVAHVYLGSHLEKERRAGDFSLLARVAARVPVFRLRRPDDLRSLPAVCEYVLRKLSTAQTSGNAHV